MTMRTRHNVLRATFLASVGAITALVLAAVTWERLPYMTSPTEDKGDLGAQSVETFALRDSIARVEDALERLAVRVESLERSSAIPGSEVAERASDEVADSRRAVALEQFSQQLSEQRNRLASSISGEQIGQRQLQQLVRVGGFAPDQADWIQSRAEELMVEAMEAEVAGAPDGHRPDRLSLIAERTRYVHTNLRAELGEVDYENYRRAHGLSTEVRLSRVLASSIAESAGLRAGDAIISVDGKRVMDMRDVEDLVAQGTQPMTIEIERDGERFYLAAQRGVLGVVQEPNLGTFELP